MRMFGNRVLRKVFGPNREEVTGGRKKLHNGELHDFCSSAGVIQMIKSGRMQWPRHVAHTGENRNVYMDFVRET
jgi:hypothetical protein